MNPSVISFFEQHDPILHSVFQKLDLTQKPIELISQPTDQFFMNLAESIVSQQLSVKASDTIWKRFMALLPDQQLEPNAILELEDDQLRAVGLSRAKVVYIKALATAIRDQEIKLEELPAMNNEEVIRTLTWVKGIGQWTAEMFMMFTLGRPDVFSIGDLALRNAVQRWYGSSETELSRDQIAEISQRWSPYRTYAARILWRSLELPKSTE